MSGNTGHMHIYKQSIVVTTKMLIIYMPGFNLNQLILLHVFISLTLFPLDMHCWTHIGQPIPPFDTGTWWVQHVCPECRYYDSIVFQKVDNCLISILLWAPH
jgi:hypothetical protein